MEHTHTYTEGHLETYTHICREALGAHTHAEGHLEAHTDTCVCTHIHTHAGDTWSTHTWKGTWSTHTYGRALGSTHVHTHTHRFISAHSPRLS